MQGIDPPRAARRGAHWQRFLAQAALGLSVALLASALVCLVAANWPVLPVIARLAGAQALLVACTAAAWLLGRRAHASPVLRRAHAAALLLAGMALGALLALVGQTYQTGADSWQLFAWWAALLLPWAWAGGAPVWILWVLVSNVAMVFLLGERTPLAWLTVTTQLAGIVLGAFNLALLGAWEAAALRWAGAGRAGPRLLAFLTLAGITFSVMPDGAGVANWLIWAAVAAGLAFWFATVRPDRAVLAMLGVSAMVVSLRVAGQWLWSIDQGPWIALPLAVLLLAEAAWMARWLRRGSTAARESAAQSRPEEPEEDASAASATATATATAGFAAGQAPAGGPWYVQALLAIGAWLATLLLLGFAAFSDLVTLQTALPAGAGLAVTGALALRVAGQRVFARQAAVALAWTGLLMAGFGLLADDPSPQRWALYFACAAVLYAAGPDRTLRLLCGLVMGAACVGGFFALHTEGGVGRLLLEPAGADALRTRLVPVAVLGWGAAAAFLTAHAARPALAPLAWAWALVAQAYVWMVGGVPLAELPALWGLYPAAALAAAALVALPALCLALLASDDERGLSPAWRTGATLGMLCLALLWTAAPGISLALAWMVLGHGQGRRHLAAFGLLAGLLYLVQYYYHLQVSLLDKAVWLGAAGGVALLLHGIALVSARGPLLRPTAPPRRRTDAGALRAYPWRAALTALGLVVALAFVNTGIWLREQTLAHGQVVRLALAPVDPRGFMQGDYMALNFEVALQMMRLRAPGAPPDAPFHEVPADGFLILRADERGVAQLVRLQPAPQPRAAHEMALRYRKRAGRVQIVTNAYFFPEGQAGRFEPARYGEFRVNEYGTGLLVRLLDEQLRPL